MLGLSDALHRRNAVYRLKEAARELGHARKLIARSRESSSCPAALKFLQRSDFFLGKAVGHIEGIEGAKAGLDRGALQLGHQHARVTQTFLNRCMPWKPSES